MKKNILVIFCLLFAFVALGTNFTLAGSAQISYEKSKRETFQAIDRELEKEGRGETSRYILTETPVIELSKDSNKIVWKNNNGHRCSFKDKCYILVEKGKNNGKWVRGERWTEIFTGVSKDLSSLEAKYGYGDYNIRLCAEYNDSCYNYSNAIDVVLSHSGISTPQNLLIYSSIFFVLMIILILLIEYIFLKKLTRLKNKSFFKILGLLLLITFCGIYYFRTTQEATEVSVVKNTSWDIKILKAPNQDDWIYTEPIVYWDVVDAVFDDFEIVWNKVSYGGGYHFNWQTSSKYSASKRSGEIKPYWGDGLYHLKICGFLDNNRKVCKTSFAELEAPFYYDIFGYFTTPKGLSIFFLLLLPLALILTLLKRFIRRYFNFSINLKINNDLNKNFKNKSLVIFSFLRKNIFTVMAIFSITFGMILIFIGYSMLQKNEPANEELKTKIKKVKEAVDLNIEIDDFENYEEENGCHKDGECASTNKCSEECLKCYSNTLRAEIQLNKLVLNNNFYDLYTCLVKPIRENINDITMEDIEHSIKKISLMDMKADGEKEVAIFLTGEVEESKIEKPKGSIATPSLHIPNFIIWEYNKKKYTEVFLDNVPVRGIVDYNYNGKDQILDKFDNIYEYIYDKFVLVSSQGVVTSYCKDNEVRNCLFDRVDTQMSPDGTKMAWLPDVRQVENYLVLVMDNNKKTVESYSSSLVRGNSFLFPYIRWEGNDQIVIIEKDSLGMECIFNIERINLKTGKIDRVLEYNPIDRQECFFDSNKTFIEELADDFDKILPFYLSKMKAMPNYEMYLKAGNFSCDSTKIRNLTSKGYEIVGGCLYKDGKNILQSNLYGLLKVGYFGELAKAGMENKFLITELFREEKDGYLNIYLDLNYDKKLAEKNDSRRWKLPYLKINLETGEILRDYMELGRASQIIFSPDGKKAIQGTFIDVRLIDISNYHEAETIHTLPEGSGVISLATFGLVPGAITWLDNDTIKIQAYKAEKKSGQAEPVNMDVVGSNYEYESAGVPLTIKISDL